MKDFCTGRDINIQTLLDILHDAEEQPEHLFKMDILVNSCGTAGCLLGTHAIRRKLLNSWHNFKDINIHFSNFGKTKINLTDRESHFLFFGHSDDGLTTPNKTIPNPSSVDAIQLTQEQAIRRLRKFIYWKMRKSELLENPEARTKEGNWNFHKEIEKCGT